MYKCAVLGVVVGLTALSVAKAAEKEPQGGVKFSARCLMVNPNEGCAVADVNKDGKLDIVAGSVWFAAPDFIPRPVRNIEMMQDEFFMTNGDHIYDVNGDGWPDVVAGNWSTPEVYWFKNPGEVGLKRGYLWEKSLLKTTRGENEAFELRDIDGDGKPELFVNSWDDKAPVVVWKFVKDAQGKPTIARHVIGDQGSGHGYAFGDINGDGREDLVVATGWYEKPEKDVLTTLWKFHPEIKLPHSSCSSLIIDVNGDGRNDIVWGHAHDYGLYWLEQGEPKADGTTTWTQHDIDKSWSQAHHIVAADIDGDGKPEIITGKRVRGHAGGDGGVNDPECVYYYKWDKEAKKFDRYPVVAPGSGVGIGMQIRVADMNGDGRPDIVVSGKTGTWLLINEGVAK
jgi:hypothetical protein